MKLLSSQYEALITTVREAAEKLFLREATHDELMEIKDEIINEIPRLKENLARLKSLSDKRDEINAEYDKIFKHIKATINEHTDAEYFYYKNETYDVVDSTINEIAKKLARERHLIKKFTHKAEKMISNKVLMTPTRNKDMDEIAYIAMKCVADEIESNPDIYID